MFLKALVICEDARFELAGTLSLVGIFREHVIGAPLPAAGGVMFPRLVFVAMVGGLSNIADVQHRFSLRGLDVDLASRDEPFTSEPRDADADEHIFLFGNAPMVFPAQGRYEVALDVIALGQRATYRYPFQVSAAASTLSAR